MVCSSSCLGLCECVSVCRPVVFDVIIGPDDIGLLLVLGQLEPGVGQVVPDLRHVRVNPGNKATCYRGSSIRSG